MAVGKLVHHHGDIDKPLVLVSELCPREQPDPNDAPGWRKIWLAGQCLLEIGLKRAERGDLGPDLIQRVRNRITHLITHDLLEPRKRAEAGAALSVIGDSRDLEEMVQVPAGGFLMGSEEGAGYSDERLQHTVTLEAYRIGKYPVTNEQDGRFINATNHRPPDHWKDPATGILTDESFFW